MTKLMGILNITPDSFSDGGKFFDLTDALCHAKKMIEDGAEIIDVGGQSTRPGHTPVSAREEAQRILPVVTALKKLNIKVSVDTYYSTVAEQAIKAGADMINDIWGLKYDPDMARVIAKYDALCCLMDNSGEMDAQTEIVAEVQKRLGESVEIALKAGINPKKIILDPGIGFAKTQEQNLQCLAALSRFHSLGYPLLLGTSRKSVIGKVLDLPTGERLEGTLATTVLAVLADYEYVRVHDVAENARAIKMTEEIKKWIK